jgi:hypothetical protein
MAVASWAIGLLGDAEIAVSVVIMPRKGALQVACTAHTVPQHWEWVKFDALGYLIVTSPIRNQN